MPRVGDLQVWVEVNGCRLAEYGGRVLDRSLRVLSCISSEAGQDFTVCFSHHMALDKGIQPVAQVYIDGIQTNQLLLNSEHVTRCEGTITGSNSQRRFQFAKLPRSMKANRETSLVRAHRLGNIQVVVRLARLEAVIPTPKFAPRILLDAMRPVHQRVKSMTAHYTSFGPEVTTRAPHGQVKIHFLKESTPIEVDYQYAPREIWQVRDIIPMDDQYEPFKFVLDTSRIPTLPTSNETTPTHSPSSSTAEPYSGCIIGPDDNFLDLTDDD